MRTRLFRALPTLLAGASLAALLVMSPPAAAKLYKWVDENGVTQYTAYPPPKGDYKNIKAPPKPAVEPAKAKSDLEQRIEDFNKRRDDGSKSKAEADKKSAEAAENKAKCAKAKQNLEYYETHPRIKFKDNDGQVSVLGEEQRQKKMQDIRDVIIQVCK